MARKKKSGKKKKSSQKMQQKIEEPKVEETSQPPAEEEVFQNPPDENEKVTTTKDTESSTNGLPPLAPAPTSATNISVANRLEGALSPGDASDPMKCATPDSVERSMSYVVTEVEKAAEAMEKFLNEGEHGSSNNVIGVDGDDGLASDIKHMEDAQVSVTRELDGMQPELASEVSSIQNQSIGDLSLLDAQEAKRAEETMDDDTYSDDEPPPPDFPSDVEELMIVAMASSSTAEELEAGVEVPSIEEPPRDKEVPETVVETAPDGNSPERIAPAVDKSDAEPKEEQEQESRDESEPKKDAEDTDVPVTEAPTATNKNGKTKKKKTQIDDAVLTNLVSPHDSEPKQEQEQEQQDPPNEPEPKDVKETNVALTKVPPATNENGEMKKEEMQKEEAVSSAPVPPNTEIAPISRTEAEALAFMVESLKIELGAEAVGVSDDNLYKFILWKKDVIRAATRFRAHVEWRHRNPSFFDEIPLQVSHDAIMFRIAQSGMLVAPEEMVTKTGSPVLVGQLDKNDMSSDARTANDIARMVFYAFDRMIEREAAQRHGITILLDMSAVSGKNFDSAIPKLLATCGGCFPIRINAIYCLSTPWWLKNVCKAHFSPELRARVQFIKNVSEIYDVIEKEKFLTDHGGEVEFDAYSWVSTQMQRESTGEVGSLKDCIVSPSSI